VKKHLSVDALVVRHIRQQEFVMKHRLPRASKFYKRDIHKQVLVFDLKNLSFTIDMQAMSAFRRTLVIDEAFYPERLEKFFMINAPWFFTTIWAMIKPWVDPITAQKIVIIGSDYLPTLREFIDDSQIPASLGGSRDDFYWTFPENRTEEDEYMEMASFVSEETAATTTTATTTTTTEASETTSTTTTATPATTTEAGGVVLKEEALVATASVSPDVECAQQAE
jgi:hypothetical protein